MERARTFESPRDAAVVWHERLHRDKVSPDLKRNFEMWLAESAHNREAYESVDRAWGTLKSAGESPQILALRHETALRLTRHTSSHTRPWRWTVAAAAVAGIVTAGAWVYPTERPLLPALLTALHDANHQRYMTATGERLAFTLSDGSQVTLDTQSELNVDFNAGVRRVRLARGQAFFEVAKDPKRPFVVATRIRQFVAVGTAFDVRVDGDQVKITIVEGTVRVEPVASDIDSVSSSGLGARSEQREALASSGSDTGRHRAPAIATITAGEQLVSDAGREDHVRGADPERDTSWRRGQVVFENERLEDAVAEINRYSELKVTLGEPSLADVRVSGAFSTGRPNVFIEAITTYFPIKVSTSDDKRVVLEKKN